MECCLFVGRVTAGGSHGMLFVCWEGDCWGEPWNVMYFVWRVTAGGAMECCLFVGRVIAGGSHGMLFVCLEGDCWGEPWNVMYFVGRVTAGGSHGMLFLGCEGDCCDPVLVEVPIPAET